MNSFSWQKKQFFCLKTLSGALLASQTSYALKVGLLSDIHMHLKYDSLTGTRIDEQGDCMEGSGEFTTVRAPMGRYGCDSPAILVEQMLTRLVDRYGKQDVILVTGDFAAHHLNKSEDEDEVTQTYALMLDTMGHLNELIAEKFPDTLVLPAFGNNDSMYHDNPIPDEDSPFFYQYIFNLWFKLLPGNSSLLCKEQIDGIYETFMRGGYYRVDLNDHISVLSINTLYYDSKRNRDDNSDAGIDQMFWLAEQLEHAEEGRKFIILQHVYGGSRFNSHPMWFSFPNQTYF